MFITSLVTLFLHYQVNIYTTSKNIGSTFIRQLNGIAMNLALACWSRHHVTEKGRYSYHHM